MDVHTIIHLGGWVISKSHVHTTQTINPIFIILVDI